MSGSTGTILVFVALVPSIAVSQSVLQDARGVFLPLGGGFSAEVSGARPSSVLDDQPAPPGVVRSRRVAIDFALLGDRLDGLRDRPVTGDADASASLVFNFFDDASVEVSVDAVDPAVLGDGYVLSGSVAGRPGSVVFVVHVDSNDRVVAVSGSAALPGAAFRVSAVGGGVYSIEEIDASAPWVDGVVTDPSDLPEPVEPPLSPSVEPDGVEFPRGDLGASASSSAVSDIDVLVLYTAAAAAQAGGQASMVAEVERLFGETNTAFRNSGVSARVSGWIQQVSYTESGDTGVDLERLKGAVDGYLDGVHAIRREVGADLVHLLVAFTPEFSADGTVTCGVAYSGQRSDFGFGVTLYYHQCRYTFTHELGHNLGLLHDRYQTFTYGGRQAAHVPFAYGYSNAATFSPIGGGQCWHTVMAYYKHCFDVPGGRAFTTPVLRFSSPYLRHPWSGEPLGVLGELETRRADGPADAARALERTRARVAAYYRRPDPRSAPTGVDLAVLPGSVSVSPIIVVAGDDVIVRAQIENVGASRVGTSTVSYWVRYDEAGAEWVRLLQQTTGALVVASERTVTATRRITADDPSGSLYAAVCIAATGDVDTDNDCRIAAQTLVIRDVSAVSGGSLVVEADGKLAVGAEGQIEFMINDVTGEQFQIQQHWILLGYEPVDEDVWGVVQRWDCLEEVPADCWNSGGTEKVTADWDWSTRAWGFGSDGTFVALLGLEAYSWSDDDRWRFSWGEANYADEDSDAEFSYRFGVIRVDDVLSGGGSRSSEANRSAGSAGATRSGGSVFEVPLQPPSGFRDVFRPVSQSLQPPVLDRAR